MTKIYISLHEHWRALREADIRFDDERDRRYAEVASEREKALKIKETADLAALELAREIQTYKDEKANELREQISSERGLYVTRNEFQPIADFFTSQQGGSRVWSYVIGIALALAGFVVAWLLRGGV